MIGGTELAASACELAQKLGGASSSFQHSIPGVSWDFEHNRLMGSTGRD